MIIKTRINDNIEDRLLPKVSPNQKALVEMNESRI